MQIINQWKKIWSHKWGRKAIIAAVIIIPLSIPMRRGGPYKGRVLDSETRQPIVGAVAVATWTTVVPGVAGGSTRHKRVKEAATNRKGEFIIKGIRGPFFGMFTGTMGIHIYKLGYQRVYCDWNYIENPGSCYRKGGRFDDETAVFPLDRVAKDRLRYEGRPPFGGGSGKEGDPLPIFRKEVRRWEKATGLAK